MQLRPQPWTHHHAHRLFHLSMGLCFGFAALVMAAGMAVSFNAGADEIVEITATVGGVNPGPIDPPPSGSGFHPPASTANPIVTIVAEPQGQIPGRNIGSTTVPVQAYVFPTQQPSFSGTTSVSNGLVFLFIDGPVHLNSTARADEHGYWYWQSPDILPEGTYYIRAVVFDSYDLTRSGSTSVYFVVELPEAPVDPGQPGQPGQPNQPGEPNQPGQPTPGGPPVIPPSETAGKLFGIFYEVLPQYKTTEAGTKVVGWVTLVSNTGEQVENQDVYYTVISPQGKVIMETKDTVSFSQQTQFLKTFNIAPMTKSGEYTVRVSSTYNGIESVTSDKFTLKEPVAVASVAPQGPAIIWSLLILLFLLFIILVIIAYRYVRHHTRELNNINQEPVI